MKVWLILFGILVLFAAVYVVALVLGSPRAEAPTTPVSNFRGPTGLPYVKGPTGPPVSP